MPCHRLLVGFRAKWPLAGFWLRRGSKQARAIDPHQECPPWHHHWLSHEEGFVFIIGIDPHKGSHTAAVLDCTETVIGELRVSHADHVVASGGELGDELPANRSGRSSNEHLMDASFTIQSRAVTSGDAIRLLPVTLSRSITHHQSRRRRRPAQWTRAHRRLGTATLQAADVPGDAQPGELHGRFSPVSAQPHWPSRPAEHLPRKRPDAACPRGAASGRQNAWSKMARQPD
jgi:hypothetical protein